MTHVVTESCIRCRYSHCVRVCPVDCFHAGPNFMVIDPDECIDCAACVPECPVDAIYMDQDVPQDQHVFISLNAELARTWELVDSAGGPLPDAAKWKDKTDKLAFLER